MSRYKQCGWLPGCLPWLAHWDTNFHIQPVSKSSVSLSDNRAGSVTRSPGPTRTCQDLVERERTRGSIINQTIISSHSAILHCNQSRRIFFIYKHHSVRLQWKSRLSLVILLIQACCFRNIWLEMYIGIWSICLGLIQFIEFKEIYFFLWISFYKSSALSAPLPRAR